MNGDFNNEEATHVLMADVIPSVTASNHTPSIDVTNLVEAAAKETLQLQNNMVVHYPAAVTYDNDNNTSIVDTDPSQQVDGSTARNIKHRPTFTEEQISTMEAIFKHRQYLSPVERESVATATGLTAQQVRVWFQNRRQKAKQFLSFKTHQNEAELDTTVSPTKATTGNEQIDIAAILAQTQKSTNQIDTQLLQLLFPKKFTKDETDINGSDTNIELRTDDGKEGVSDDSAPTNTSLGVISSNGTITITPQALLSLTPLFTTCDHKTQEDGVLDQTDSISNNAVNAVQLLQTLSRLQNLSQLQNMTTPSKGGGGPTPLRAQSPVPVEDTLTPCSNGDIPTTATTTTTNSNTSSGLITSDVLQQILEQAAEKSKSSWSLTTTTPTSSLPPALSLSLSSSAGRSTRKKRQVFSGIQIAEMEKQFEESPYIDNKEREVLAKEIGLLPDQVKVWFQNRRTKKTRLSWRLIKEAEGQLSRS